MLPSNDIEFIRETSEMMLYGGCFNHILDFVEAKNLLKIQLINKYLYNKLIPLYFSKGGIRKSLLQCMRIPEKYWTS